MLGLTLATTLYFTQNIELMSYFSVAPYYINSLTFRGEGFINITTFIYFIVMFSLLGYVYSCNIAKKFKWLIILGIIIFHCILLRLGGSMIMDGLPKAISNALPSNSK